MVISIFHSYVQDLSVKLEGLFVPRYRFFDLFSRTAYSEDVPVLAECVGGTFAVYSTKEFPGLKASTELTKHLNRWGIRVNIRETERKRRAPNHNNAGGGATAGSGTGQGPAGRNGGGKGVDADNTIDAPKRYLSGTAAAREREAKERESRGNVVVTESQPATTGPVMKRARRRSSDEMRE